MLRIIPLAFTAALAASACQQSMTYPPDLQDPGTTPSPIGGGGDGGITTNDASLGDAPVSSSVLTSVSAVPTSIALDATNVYWTDTAGNVSRVPRGGGGSTLIVNGQDSPVGLIASSLLYWANAGNGSSPDGTLIAYDFTVSPNTLTQLATQQVAPYGVITDAQNIYWTSVSTSSTGVDVQSAPLAPGVSVGLGNVTGDVSPGGVAVDGSNVYFVVYQSGGGGSLSSVPRIGGGVPDTRWERTSGKPTDLVLSGGILYWVVDSAPPLGAVWAVSTSGGAPAALVSGLVGPAHLAVDSFNVYWTSPTTGQVFALALATTTGVTNTPVVVATGLDTPAWIAVDDAIYVTTSTSIVRLTN